MTNPISSTQKRIIDTKPLGNDWGKIVEDIVAKAGAELAETQLKIGKQTTSDEVVVQVPLTVYIGFPRKGQGIDGTAATVSAVCVWYGNDGGTGGVCVYARGQVPRLATVLPSSFLPSSLRMGRYCRSNGYPAFSAAAA